MKNTNTQRKASDRDWWIFFLFSFIFLSRIVWYDLRTISAASGLDNSLIVYFYIWSFALLPFILYFLLSGSRLFFSTTICQIFGLIAIYALMTGLLRSNELRYIGQEIFKFSFIPAAFIATAKLPTRFSTYKVLKALANLVIVFYVVRLAIFVLFNESARIYYGTPQDLFAIIFFVAVILITGISRTTATAAFWVIFLSALTVIGQKKTLALSFVSVALFAFFDQVIRLRGIKVAFVLIVVGISGLVLYFAVASGLIDISRFTSTNLVNEVGGDSVRRIEVASALSVLQSTPLGYMFGMGGGATYQSVGFQGGSISIYHAHSIHNTAVGMLYRYGVFGIAFFCYVAICGCLWCFKRSGSNSKQLKLLCYIFLLYKLNVVLSSFAIFGLVDDFLVGVLMGLLFRYEQLSHNRPTAK